MGDLKDHIEKISPAELARLREKDQRLSSRDKALLLKKVVEIEKILNKRGEKIIVKKVE